MSLRVLSYNILKSGLGRERAIAAVVAAARPDIVILQEAYRPDAVQEIARASGFAHWASAPGHSVAFMSHTETVRHAWHRAWLAKRAYLEIDLANGFRVFGVHLSAVHSNVTEQRRGRELGALLRSVARHQDGPHLVTGDFNTVAPGERLDLKRLPPRLRALAWVTGRSIRWITVKMMLEAGYVDAYRRFHTDEGYTYPTHDPHVRLDYAFLPSPIADRLTRCEVVRSPSEAASDHFPLLTEVAL